MTVKHAPSPPTDHLAELAKTLNAKQHQLLARFVYEQEAQTQAAIARIAESTSAVYAIYADIQSLGSVLASR